MSEYSYQGARYLLFAMQDMTQRHEMEVLKQEFVNSVSNDLKAPLLQVQSTLSTLTNRPVLNEKGRDWVQRSEQESQRLVALVNELIEAQEVESGQMQLSKKMHSVFTIVDRAIESVRPVAQKSKVQVENCTEDCSLLCNDARLIQVLVNLLSNAIKFSFAQGKVTVESLIIGPWLELRITDQGRGIPSSHLQSVFEKFVQVDKADAKVGKGTGLGLTISKSIVEAHGGTIGVESEVGKGTTFWLRLPFSQA
ncbi:MAG: HAMP domain-containing histidine kinase [Candidatus Melainabacteria bacterium]|nr:HAMP domain-containing histidine kinase [Candidatus Melainabacteria bacterium]